MVRFDAYTATTTAVNHYQLGELLALPGGSWREGRGVHGFAHRAAFVSAEGHEVGSVQWGGSRHGDRAMIEVKGEPTPAVVERLRSLCPHRVSRVDSCADFDAPGAFSRVLRACQRVKREHRVWGEKRGDWDDQPEKGRTFYLGASQSSTRARLYEKGLQPEYAHLGRTDWVRLESQVRPQKDAKGSFSMLSPFEVWGASTWSRDLAARILQEHVDPHPAGTVWRKSSLMARTDWICTQGGPTLLELLAELGTWECVGLTLGQRIAELQQERRRQA